MRGSNKLLAATATVAGCSFAATALHAPMPVKATFAFALLASLGYVWIEVFLRGRAPMLELASVAIGVVLAVLVIGSLVLQEAGVLLHPMAWSILLAGLVLAGDAIVAFRYRCQVREHDNGEETPLPDHRQAWLQATRPDLCTPVDGSQWLTPQLARGMNPRPREAKSRLQISPWQAGACAIAVVIAGGAIWLAQAGAASQQYPGFTELWLTSRGQSTATDNLGVRNQEGGTEQYRLVLLREGHVSATWELRLAAGGTWLRAVQITGETKANLYLLPDLKQPYRSVNTEPQIKSR